MEIQGAGRPSPASAKLVNLGCGASCHPDWINLDVEPRAPGVRHWDVRHGLPLPEQFADAVYMSHLLEHLPLEAGAQLLENVFRVIRPGGIVRVVVPDLEGVCKAYLSALEAAWNGEDGAADRYDWMAIELLDQMVRAHSGGRMLRHIMGASGKHREFIRSRIGLEADYIWTEANKPLKVRLRQRLRQNGPRWAMRKVRLKLAGFAVRIVGGRSAGQAFQEAAFRNSGEVHRWMYDRYGLKQLLEQTGFVNYRVCDAWTSAIPSFSCYELDAVGQQVRKPDSIFVEASKP